MGSLLDIRSLEVTARVADGTRTVLRGIDLTLERGEIVGVVGESGSGKTTLARSLIGLLDGNVSVTGGEVALDGRTVLSPTVDLTAEIRGSHVGMVFQDAARSLDPLFKVRSQLREVLAAHEPGLDREAAEARMTGVLERMLIAEPARVLDSYPHQLSGGMRQRVAIAAAIISRPRLVLADECTTALDVTTQAEVVGLLRELVGREGLSLLFITHDLMLASDLCGRIVVMSRGEIVEAGRTEDVLGAPRHPYTRTLLEAVPSWDAVAAG